MTATIGEFSASDRLYVDSAKGRFLVDTELPNTIVFTNKVLSPEQANNLPIIKRFDEMLALEKPLYQTNVAHFELKLNQDFESVPTLFAINLVGDGARDAFSQKSEGAIGIVGMDILKKCDFVWLAF